MFPPAPKTASSVSNVVECTQECLIPSARSANHLIIHCYKAKILHNCSQRLIFAVAQVHANAVPIMQPNYRGQDVPYVVATVKNAEQSSLGQAISGLQGSLFSNGQIHLNCF